MYTWKIEQSFKHIISIKFACIKKLNNALFVKLDNYFFFFKYLDLIFLRLLTLHFINWNIERQTVALIRIKIFQEKKINTVYRIIFTSEFRHSTLANRFALSWTLQKQSCVWREITWIFRIPQFQIYPLTIGRKGAKIKRENQSTKCSHDNTGWTNFEKATE